MFHVKHQHFIHDINTDPSPAHRSRAARMRLVAALAGAALFLGGCAGVAKPLGWAPPVPANEAVLVQVAPGQIALLDPATGNAAWRFPQEKDEANPFYATPLIDGSTVYLAGYSGLVRRLDISGGAPVQVWEVQLEHRVVATPVVDGDTLLVPTEHGGIERLSMDSGNLGETIPTDESRVWGAPAFSNGILYLGDLDRGVTLAIDPATGQELWSQSFVGASSADLVVADGLLYVASFDRSLHALDIGNGGAERWTFQGDGWFMGAPLVQGDTVYVATMRGTVYALDAATGAQRWAQTMEGAEYRTTPVVANASLVAIDRKGLITALDLSTGTPIWTITIEDVEFNAHAMVRGTDIFLVTSQHDVLKVDAANTGAVQRLTVSD
ncbi:MAG: PQQ-binding-like beta-propeller repeat protein [Dehalococcoidia bacterium]|nr:PQQ-binding-like beta-propeller repeat protein [Dehalococcoidia bacterium]